MCWISITKKSKVRETLLNQKDRGLDSVWIITMNGTNWKVANNYRGYKKFIKREIWWGHNPKDGIAILHHRKASIGAINIKNAHPFNGRYFQLMQNGTSQVFYNTHKLQYKKDTDSETLLNYIEDRTSNIAEVPSILEQLSSRIKEDFGVIILVDKLSGQILFYTDGARETYLDLDLENNKVNWLYNYEPWKKEWWDNRWWLLMDFSFNLLENTFEKINEDTFYLFYSGNNGYTHVETTPYCGDYTEPKYWGNQHSIYYSCDDGIRNLNKEELNEYNSMFDFLVDEWVNLYSQTKEYWMKDYIWAYYGVETIHDYKVYYKWQLDLQKIFNLAYNKAFWF